MHSIISDKGNKTQLSREIYENDNIWWHNQLRHKSTDKHDSNGKVWYFLLNDDDKKMNHKYIITIA